MALLDFRMNGINILQAVKEFRLCESWDQAGRCAIVIATSSEPPAGGCKQILEAGLDDCLTTPCTKETPEKVVGCCTAAPKAPLAMASESPRFLPPRQARLNSPEEARLVDELTRLNNELAGMQRELVRANTELKTANLEKNQFLGMAAHDLRNPLGVIAGMTEVITDEIGGTINAEQRELLNVIKRSAEFMLGLVDDLLDFAKIEAGKLELELRATDVVELLRNNLTLSVRSAQHKNIDLVSTIEGQSRPILIDARRIEQVLNNLISNAIKFSPPDTRIKVTLRFGDRELVLTVADQGLGIPANELGKLFKPFSRTSNVGTANESGTGLGLAITRRIVEAHRGHIQVESRVGVGSAFRIVLPLH